MCDIPQITVCSLLNASDIKTPSIFFSEFSIPILLLTQFNIYTKPHESTFKHVLVKA